MPPAIALWLLLAATGGFAAHLAGFERIDGALLGLICGTAHSLWLHWKAVKAEQARAFTEMCLQEERDKQYEAAKASSQAQWTTTVAHGSAINFPNYGQKPADDPK